MSSPANPSDGQGGRKPRAVARPPADDDIFLSFLEASRDAGLALADSSDLLDLEPELRDPPAKFIATYHCTGLVQEPNGDIVEGTLFGVGIWFPCDYLEIVNPYQVVTWLGPSNVFHSNLRAPFVCLKSLAPGTDLVSILFQLFELISWTSYALHDALNEPASQWARNHQDRLPVDRRPLKRKAIRMTVEETSKGRS